MTSNRASKPQLSQKPLVAVIGDVKQLDGYDWHATPDQYVTAINDVARATPLIVPAVGDLLDMDGLLARVDGLVCTGSRSNVHPSNYGADATEGHEPYDEARDATSLPLIRKAIDLGLPLLCICRGMQELNVALGGSLMTEIQEQDGRMDHRAPVSEDHRERFAIRHPVVLHGSALSGVLGEGDVHVNSLHRQAIDRLADGLNVEAVAEDGTVEAVSVRGATGFAAGVQWHPEYWARTDQPSRQLFEAFGDATRSWIAGEKKPLGAAA